MIHHRTRLGVAIALLLAACSGTAWAQQGKISGVVRDGSGAALPGVTVTATNQSTRGTQSVASVNDGSFSMTVAAGTYTVTASLVGFRRTTQTGDVGAGAALQLTFQLEVQLTEVVTVTAMKREESLLDVPFSVAAPTAELLRSRGVENIEGVAANVGGFTVQNLGPGQSQVAMRGVSAGQIVRDQPGVKEQVGVYLDESPMSMSLFTPDIDLFDTDRVEVLRGPQGTLFGAGSLSGTVRYITNQPQLNSTNMTFELQGSSVQSGNQGGNAKFAFNVPLGDQAALRVASYVDRQPGFIKAVQPGLGVINSVNDGYKAGVRATARIAPNDRLTITPRILFQRVDMNGWNRVDVFNILANPYTTKRPPVTLDNSSQFTQLKEEFTDKFTLGDVDIKYGLGGGVTLTSVSSFTNRDILVIRDATALTASITGGSIGLSQPVYTLNAPLNDATTAKAFTEEVRLSGDSQKGHWLVGGFFGHSNRHYAQNLVVTGFQNLSGVPTKGIDAPIDSLFWSDLHYSLNQFAAFGEATIDLTPEFSLTGGLRYYHFSEDKQQIFDGIFGNDNNGKSLVTQPGTTNANGAAPRIIANYKLSDGVSVNAQVSRGFRLGGINDPLNVPLCTAQDLITFGGRDTWKDETAWNYEAGLKTRLPHGMGSFSVSAFLMDVTNLQVTVTAGSCSSRLIFNVPSARSQGFETELTFAPNRNFELAVSASFDDSTLRSTLTSTAPGGVVSVVSGIQSGNRLPTVPRFQSAEAATYQWEVRQGAIAYITGSHQYVGSRFTQVGDQSLGTLNLNSFGANTIGGPLTASTFTYNPELPSYNIVNGRVGVRHGNWDISFYINNLTNEQTYLAFDQERGTRARISFLTNQPRTFGVSTRFLF